MSAPRWPPSPSVEDECESLSREWHGQSGLGPSPGGDGVCARGTVDQLPVLVARGAPCAPSLSRSTTISEDSSGPATPEASTDPASRSGSPSVSRSSSSSPSSDCPKDDSDDDSDASFCTAPLPSSRPQLSRHVSEETTLTLTKRDRSQKAPALMKSSREDSPSQRATPSAAARNPNLLRLLPCPRSVPVAGYHDWHSLSGLAHLKLCPPCTRQITGSRFRDRLVPAPAPALSKSRGQKTHCSFSEPWTRLAWMQTLKKGLDSLAMLDHITRPFPASTPCPGRVLDDQYWYRVVDSSTGMYLPRFSICSTCARNLKTLMPSLRNTFKRSTSKQQRVCDLVPESPRFIQYIDLLDLAANRADAALALLLPSSPSPPSPPFPPFPPFPDIDIDIDVDLSEFLAYARRKLLLRPCRRDRPILSTWHYMPQLPELTVCEDCYDDVILPLAHPTSTCTSNQKHYQKQKPKPNPIAAAFHPTPRLLPGPDRTARCLDEASCQLYSAHMRAKFRKAVVVARDDLAYLGFVARRRVDAEREFRARVSELLLREEVLGVDVEEELGSVVGEWRRWE